MLIHHLQGTYKLCRFQFTPDLRTTLTPNQGKSIISIDIIYHILYNVIFRIIIIIFLVATAPSGPVPPHL